MRNNLSEKPILVTGGAGFIGSHLIDRLLDDGSHVVCLDNLNDFYNPEIKKLNQKHHFNFDGFTFIEGDIRDKEAVAALFDTHDVGIVVHLAAMAGVRPSLDNPTLYTDVNIQGTQNLLEAVKEKNLEKFIFASSSSVYGNNKKTPFSEDDRVDHQVSPYGATKKMGEILCHPYHQLYGIPMACLRFFTVYGPRQRPEMAIHKFLRKIRRGEEIPFFGDGTTARDYTYIDDIVDGIFRAMVREEEFSIYNLGNSEPVKLSDLVSVLENTADAKAVLHEQPLPPGDVVQTYADISRARQKLDYEPATSIDDGIASFVNWYDERCQKDGELFR